MTPPDIHLPLSFSDIICAKLAASSLSFNEACEIFSLAFNESFVNPSDNLSSLQGHQRYETPAVLGMYRPVRRLCLVRTLTILEAFFKELVFVTQGATLNEALARCRVDNIIILYIYVSRKKRGSR